MHESGMQTKGRLSKGAGRGFTLIEVVIAIGILGIGLTVIVELLAGGLRLARVADEQTKAINHAHVKMEEILTKPGIQEGTEEGEIDSTFRWQVGIKKMNLLPDRGTDFKPPVELMQVKVSIFWKSGARERSTGVESCRLIKSPT